MKTFSQISLHFQADTILVALNWFPSLFDGSGSHFEAMKFGRMKTVLRSISSRSKTVLHFEWSWRWRISSNWGLKTSTISVAWHSRMICSFAFAFSYRGKRQVHLCGELKILEHSVLFFTKLNKPLNVVARVFRNTDTCWADVWASFKLQLNATSSEIQNSSILSTQIQNTYKIKSWR
jgi:hypothetical protein